MKETAASKAASLMGKRSYRARLERFGLERLQAIARENGKKGGRPKVAGRSRSQRTMSVYRPQYSDKKTGKQRRTKIWYYKFIFAGRLIKESAKTTSKTVAKEAEKRRRRELEEGFNGVNDARDLRMRPLGGVGQDIPCGLRYASTEVSNIRRARHQTCRTSTRRFNGC